MFESINYPSMRSPCISALAVAILPLRRYSLRGIVAWVIDEADRCVIADTVAHLGLCQRSDEATSSMHPALHGVVSDVLDTDFHAEGDSALSHIPPPGVINIRSRLQGDLSLISIKVPRVLD